MRKMSLTKKSIQTTLFGFSVIRFHQLTKYHLIKSTNSTKTFATVVLWTFSLYHFTSNLTYYHKAYR